MLQSSCSSPNLQFGYTRQLGEKHGLFISLMGARWIVVGQSSFSSLSPLTPWSHHEALPWAKRRLHNGHPQQTDGHSGSGTRIEDKEARRQREKRKKAKEGPGEAAPEVAGQAEQLFCCVTGLLQETALWCTFSSDDLYCFQD